MTTTTAVTLDAADAIELAELLEHINDWLDDSGAAASYQRFTDGLHTTHELRADLARFAQLLSGEGHS